MAPLTRGLELLGWAISYALASTRLATPQRLPGPTPCADWDLGLLLRHVSDSVGVLHEAITTGCIGSGPAAEDDEPDPDVVSGLYRRAGCWPPALRPPQPPRPRTWSPSVTRNCPRRWPSPPGPSRSLFMAGTSRSRAAAAGRSRRTWPLCCCRSPRCSSLPAAGRDCSPTRSRCLGGPAPGTNWSPSSAVSRTAGGPALWPPLIQAPVAPPQPAPRRFPRAHLVYLYRPPDCLGGR